VLFFAPLALIGAGFAVLWVLRRGPARPLLIALAYHALLVLPILGLVDIAIFHFTPRANHLQYLALMGPAALVGAALARASAGRWRTAATALGAALVLALGAATAVRASAYRDDLALWTRAAREAPQSLMAAWMYAEKLAETGRPDLALRSLADAADRIHDPADRCRARALVLLQRRQVDAALEEAQAARAIRADPVFDFEIAQMLVQAGRPAEAVEGFARLVGMEPRSPEYRVALGRALGAAGRHVEAAGELQTACRSAPRYPGACASYVEALGRLGRSGAARAEIAAALGVAAVDPEVDAVLAQAAAARAGH
jgi:predicted Zn-dependent protease